MAKLHYDGEVYDIEQCAVYAREEDEEAGEQEGVGKFLIEDFSEELINALWNADGYFGIEVAGLRFTFPAKSSSVVASDEKPEQAQFAAQAEEVDTDMIQVALIYDQEDVNLTVP